MKKLIMCMCVVILILSTVCIAYADGNPWPVRSMNGVSTSLKKLSGDDQRHQSYYGPGKKFHGGGAYKPGKVSSITALFREGDFVLADISYPSVGRRCLYFRASSLTNSDVEEVRLQGYSAETTTVLIPLNGPGTEYDTVTQTVPSKYDGWTIADLVATFGGAYEPYLGLLDTPPQRNTIYLDERTALTVYFETNGWVFAEFNCSLGNIRAWLPANSVVSR